ncbi:uncharacterized protein PHALS_10880 [Plasmopara halstedii]|uniref:Uncharacterized protein n=1 Tax=Plasmopara halstedii TaxID=4781 RepID=A0A0P1AJK3_PLAHL|nr:uncharacterized protein PHALS_10880 [Plasmopara halstedii]CEG40696.1 hypothetical protein PHALS_10880 [Plasmopara halstedii]|eukprot:XP_024577065.1 hypothetical protein PHALS_10880 [Plasmopara halstedii]
MPSLHNALLIFPTPACKLKKEYFNAFEDANHLSPTTEAYAAWFESFYLNINSEVKNKGLTFLPSVANT